MIPTLVLWTVVGYAAAIPTGTYHQEYSYKSSSSSFKNNELQHKTDDQGYYKKDGDLEGRTKPRIDANSEHSEYVNPNLRGNQYVGYGDSTDMSSYGHMNANSGVSSYGTNNLAESIASSDRIIGSRGYSAGSGTYGSNYGSSNYGSSSYGSGSYGTGTFGTGSYGSTGYHTNSYGSTASLQSVIQRLQQDFERDLQDYRWRDAYSQTNIDRAELERQLRQNLTERLNSELLSQYGQQTIRNGMSYSLSGGHVQSNANYDNQELATLKQQLENNLLNRLRNQYNEGYGTSGGSSHYQSQSESHTKYGYSSSTIRPGYQTIYPSLPLYQTTPRTSYGQSSNFEVISSNVRYTPIPNPESISNIASGVQTQLDSRLNQVLDDVYRKYFSTSSSYQLTNYDVVLNRLQDELRNNITYLIDDSLRRNYGSQSQRDGYLYSIGPSGQISSEHNYALRDLETLKAQVERNLIEKLNREFNTYRTRYSSQSHSYNSQSSYTNYVTSPTIVYTTPRAHYSSGIKGGSIQNNYGYTSGSRQSGYEYTGGSYGGGSSYTSGTYGTSDLSALQSQLQAELSRQLQAAISRDSSSYSSYGSYSPQNYQNSLQHLTDELNRNVSRHLQEYSASASYSASGDYDQSQIDNLKSQLLSSLTQQLQQNLRQHFQSGSASSSSSYSASSSSANYRPVRAFQNYHQGQYRSGGSVITGEDCDHGDVSGYRMKRSLYQPYRSQPLSYYHSSDHSHSGYGYSGSHSYSHSGSHRYGDSSHPSYQQTGQEEDNTDVGQQEELGQEVEQEEAYMPVQHLNPKPLKLQDERNIPMVSENFGQLHTGQHENFDDVGQQVVEEDFGQLHVGKQDDIGQQTDDSDTTQPLEVGYSHNSQNIPTTNFQHQTGQEEDNSEIVGSSVYSPLQTSYNEHQQQEVDHIQTSSSHLQHSGYNQLHVGQQFQDAGQQEDNFDLTQNIEDLGQQVEEDNIGQTVDESDQPINQLSQNIHSSYTGYSQVKPLEPVNSQIPREQVAQVGYGSPVIQEVGQEQDNFDLTQQTEQFGSFQTGQQIVPDNVGQEVDDSDVYSIQPGNTVLSQAPSQYQPVSSYEPGRINISRPIISQYEAAFSGSHFGHSGNFQLNQNQQISTPSYGVVAEIRPLSWESIVIQRDVNTNGGHGINYWLSHSWKPSQEQFIEKSKQTLVSQLDESLRNAGTVHQKKEEILKEIAVNLTRQFNLYNNDYLSKNLELTHEEFEGLKATIFEQLRKELEKKTQDYYLQTQTVVDSNRGTGGVNQYLNQQRPSIPSGSLHSGQEQETGGQQVEQDENLYLVSGLQNEINTNRGHGINYWVSYQWKPSQERFIERSKQTLLSKLDKSLRNVESFHHTKEEILKEIEANIKNEFSLYSGTYLTQHLELTKEEIEGIKATLFEQLRKELDKKTQHVNLQTQNVVLSNQRPSIPSGNLHLGQEQENDGQQVEQDGNFLVPSSQNIAVSNYGHQGETETGQEEDNTDLTQQAEEFDSLHTGQQQINQNIGQFVHQVVGQTQDLGQVENEDFGQTVDESDVQSFQIGNVPSSPGHGYNQIPSANQVRPSTTYLTQQPQQLDVLNSPTSQQQPNKVPGAINSVEPLSNSENIIFNHNSGYSSSGTNELYNKNEVNSNQLGSARPDQTGATYSHIVFNAHQNGLDLSNWDEKQRKFIKQLDDRLINELKGSIRIDQFQNYDSEEFNRELNDRVKNAMKNYNQFFLINYLGLKKDELDEFQTSIIDNLRTEWTKSIKISPGNGNSHSHQVGVGFTEADNNGQDLQNSRIPASNMGYNTQEQQPVIHEEPIIPVNVIATGGLNQKKPETFEGQSVEPLNTQKMVGENDYLQSTGDLVSSHSQTNTYNSRADGHYGGSRVTVGSGAHNQYTYSKPARLPDSSSFINTEIGQQQTNAQYGPGVYFSPTLNKVIGEDQHAPSSTVETNQLSAVPSNENQEPGQGVIQSNQNTGGMSRVPLNKSTGQWFGLSSQGQFSTGQQSLSSAESTADALVETLRQKQTRPQVQVVEQDELSGQSQNNDNTGMSGGYTGYGIYQTSHHNSENTQGFGASGSSSSSFQIRGSSADNRRLHYGRQEQEQQNLETAGTIDAIEVGRANAVVEQNPYKPRHPYSGVKGRRPPPPPGYGPHTPGLVVQPVDGTSASESPAFVAQQIPSSSTLLPELGSEIYEATTVINEEDLPWWKRVGNKVKQGAAKVKEGAVNLKKKIVG